MVATSGKHLSASALRVLQECPREFYFRYIAGQVRQDLPVNMLLGTAVHAGLAEYYRGLVNGRQAELRDLLEVADSATTAALAGGIPLAFKNGDDEAWLEVELERVLKAFLESPYVPDRVIGVEMPFAVPVANPETGSIEVEEELVGVFDLVAANAKGDIVVVDHKVTARLTRPASTRDDVQASLYMLAAENRWPGRAVAFAHQSLVRGKRSVRVEFSEIPRWTGDSLEAYEALVSGAALIDSALDSGRPGVVLGRRRGWRCGGCGYRSRCSGSADV